MSISQTNTKTTFKTGLQTTDLQTDSPGAAARQNTHRIYDRLLFHLENKQIRVVRTGQKLPFILHEQIKSNLSPVVFHELEEAILADAEKMSDYEVVRDLPPALHYELKRSGDESLIAANRIVAVPNFVLNAIVCAKLEKEFPRCAILGVKGFVLHRGRIRLDLDENHVRRGFMVPVVGKNLIVP